MNESIAVTIGISFYNAEATLLDAIRSVFAQTHTNWELILIDDGSTDRSLKLAQTINDPRITVYSDGENRRLAVRLNQLTKLAKYDFIARMDADDLMAPDRIEKQLEILIEKPDIDLVSTGVLSLNDNNDPVGVRVVSQEHALTAKKLLLGQSSIVHASVVARKEWYQRNCYHESYPVSQDNELWVRTYSSSDLNVFFLREPLYFYREDGSVTKEKLLRAYGLGRRILRESANSNYSTLLKLYAYFRSYFKSSTVVALSLTGKLDILRQRRSSKSLSNTDKENFHKIIVNIRRFKLPSKVD